MRVVVTGGAGFIGSNLARALCERGDDVVVVDTLTTGKRERVPAEAAFHLLDVASPLFKRLLETQPFDLIYHEAASVSVRQSVAQPAQDAEVNVLGSLRVLEAAIATGVPTVVLASSCGVYGDQAVIPIHEDAPLHPTSPYGAAKQCVEVYARVLSAVHGLHVTCLRYANVYGPGAEAHSEAGVIPLFIDALESGAAPLIYGDGRATRDYIHVDDIVRALVAARYLRGFHVINLGTGIETSVDELFTLLHERMGGPAARYAPARAGEIRRSALDTSRAASLLGWRAKVTLAKGLDRLVAPRSYPAYQAAGG